ncbi:hypothetical protein [Pantoea agglomerans]|jgi:hypothetical protein|uniref:hypothetical protein n=1 Tax=Enterobacter agglomerans TaxID=549 RepID=UPI001ABBD372|nr:hypothetical protein [Pantoea agglomerans]
MMPWRYQSRLKSNLSGLQQQRCAKSGQNLLGDYGRWFSQCIEMNITLGAKAFYLLAVRLTAEAIVINVHVMQSDIKDGVHMDTVIGIVMHLQIAHINVDQVRTTNAVPAWAGIITSAVFSGLD